MVTVRGYLVETFIFVAFESLLAFIIPCTHIHTYIHTGMPYRNIYVYTLNSSMSE